MLIQNFLLLLFLLSTSKSDFGMLLQSGLGFEIGLAAWIIAFCSFFPVPIYHRRLSATIPAELYNQAKSENVLATLAMSADQHCLIWLSLGGAIIPNLWAGGQLFKCNPLVMLIMIAMATVIGYKRSFWSSQGIQTIAVWSVPALTSLIALVLDFEHCVSSAAASSILGITLGCDVLHLSRQKIPAPDQYWVVGGAGLADAIVLSGMLAAMLTTALRHAPSILQG
jgi:uncharacterized membrane protein